MPIIIRGTEVAIKQFGSCIGVPSLLLPSDTGPSKVPPRAVAQYVIVLRRVA